MENETILVNGTLYDTVTGQPLQKQVSNRATTSPENRRAKPSHHMHKQAEVSRAIHRHAPAAPLIQKRSDARRTVQPTTTKSPAVARFAPQPSKTRSRPHSMNDIKPATPHPIAKKVEERLQQAHSHHDPVAVKPSAIIKNEAIDEALAKAPHHGALKPAKSVKRAPRMLSFASIALSLLLLTGYLTYINLPNLSVRVAANQAGINAGYPGYRPDGYRLAGVNYDSGSVSLKFAANAGPQNFTIVQQQTSWDSTAVKENYVKTNWGDDVVPYSERGLTIYAHEGNAAWVNGGILYTITGDAPLSASQVRSIATSL